MTSTAKHHKQSLIQTPRGSLFDID